MIKYRTERERILVQGGAVVVVLLLYVVLVLQPLMRRIHDYEGALNASRASLDKAQKLAGTLVYLKATQGKKRTGSPVQEVDRITRELGMQQSQQVAELKDIGNNAVQLRLEDVDGPTLVRFLDALQKVGIHPDGLKMRDPKRQGLWTVNLTVKGTTP